MKRPFFRNNFELIIPLFHPLNEERRIEIHPKGYGINFAYEVETLSYSTLVSFEGDASVQEEQAGYTENDSIVLDIYEKTGVFFGENDLPSDQCRGAYLTSLSKCGYGDTIWFDLNALMQQKASYSTAFLDTEDWADAGTVCDYRFIAKRNDGVNCERFFCSGVLYVLNGYDRPLNDTCMEDFIVDIMNPFPAKPLTNRLSATHLSGQKQYFNFILKDALHAPDIPVPESLIGLLYKFYARSGEYIGELVAHEKSRKDFNIVNTIEMALDSRLLEQETVSGKKVGKVEVCLCCNGIEISQPVTFRIEPTCSQTLHDFVFLNRLGGWDSFNFGGMSAVEFKTKAVSAYSTLRPGFGVSDAAEKVIRCSVDEQMSVKTAPVDRQTMEWLRELSASAAVFELKTKRGIIIDEFNLKYNSKDELFQAEMKYRYSMNNE
jgi:hypothetical protein